MATNNDDQTARLNRQCLTIGQRPDDTLQEAENKARAVRENMTRLRQLRLAKEAESVRTEIGKSNQPAKAKPKRPFK